jgi:hypothetical protein
MDRGGSGKTLQMRTTTGYHPRKPTYDSEEDHMPDGEEDAEMEENQKIDYVYTKPREKKL